MLIVNQADLRVKFDTPFLKNCKTYANFDRSG